MNKYLIAVVMVVLVAAGYGQRGEAQPTHICSANASSYRDLVDLGFCDIGDKTFSNFNSFFNTAAGGATPVLATDVAVTSLSGPPFWGFQFGGFALDADPNQQNIIDIFYSVTCNALAAVFNCIDSYELAMTGTTMGTGGSAGVDVSITFPGGGSGISLDTNAGSPSAAASFAGAHSVDVLETFSVHCSVDPNCFSQISVVSNTVDQVHTIDQVQIPEPATFALLDAGLLSLAAFRRRKTSR